MTSQEINRRAIEAADDVVFAKFGSYDTNKDPAAFEVWLAVFAKIFAQLRNEGRI